MRCIWRGKFREQPMDIESLRTFCKSLPSVTEDIKWGHDICFSIGGKMFLVTSADANPAGASFKTGDEDFITLIEKEGIIPAPYLARHKWVYVNDIKRLGKKEWKEFITKSYEMVRAKLPKKKK